MAKIQINDLFDEFREENTRLLYELKFSQKCVDFLENYRKCLLNLKNSCNCEQNVEIKTNFNDLENQYKDVFNENQSKSKPNESGIDLNVNQIALNHNLSITTNLVLVYNNQNVVIVEEKCENIDTNNELIDRRVDDLREIDLNDNSFREIKERLNETELGVERRVAEVNKTNKSVESTQDINSSNSALNRNNYLKNKRIRNRIVAKRGDKSEKELQKRKTINKLLDGFKNKDFVANIDPSNEMITVLRHKLNVKSETDYEIGFIAGYKCNFKGCECVSNNRTDINDHLMTHTIGKPFTCRKCMKEFGLSKYLRQHMNVVHNEQSKPVLRCHISDCGYKTTVYSALRAHESTHKTDTTIKCEHKGCEKLFKTKFKMRRHLRRMHSDLRSYICEWPECGAKFKDGCNLKRHTNMHLGTNNTITKLKLVLENGDYVSNIDLKNNMISVIRQKVDAKSRTKGSIIGFKCNHKDCQYISCEMHSITQHIINHSIGKPFECDECHKRYGFRKDLRQHKEYVHNKDNKPVLRCQLAGCGYKTQFLSNIKRHELSHKTVKDFNCDQIGCGKHFKTLTDVNRHKKTVHKNTKLGKPELLGLVPIDLRGFELRFKSKKSISLHKSKPFRR